MEIPLLLITSLGVSGILVVFSIVSPDKPSNNLSYERLIIKSKRFNRLEFISIPLILLGITVICVVVYSIGILFTENRFGDSYIYIHIVPHRYFVACGLILGFGLIRIPIELLYKRILKEEYSQYIEYGNLKHGFDGLKIWLPFEKLIIICGASLFFLGFGWFVRIDGENNNIEISQLLSYSIYEYPIYDITEIVCSAEYIDRKGGKELIVRYSIKMKDNFEWNSTAYTFFSNEDEKNSLNDKIKQLSQLANVQITCR